MGETGQLLTNRIESKDVGIRGITFVYGKDNEDIIKHEIEDLLNDVK